MNIDPTGLEEVAKPGIENSLSHYKNAYSALKAIDLPSGAKTQYKEKISSIFANIEALMSEVIGDVDKYISDLKDANISTEITVEKSTEKNIFATIGNTLLAGAKGLYSGIEWIADGAVSLYGNFHGAVLSAEAKVISWFDPKFAGYVEHGGKEVKNTLIDVAAHDYVDEHFDKEYNSNLKGIDQKSHIKYEDGVYETIAGVTSYIPTAATETFLPGSGTIMSFMGGYGRNQEETYENLKKGTREEIRIAAERGNISQEDYSLYESLWNMSEEEFYHCINMNQVTGNISSEEADLMKAIREMPDFEITDEMRGKVTTASVATASLETVQWIEGNWANGLKEVFGSKAGAVATRIVGDTVFNAVDTPYRALVDTMVFDKEFGEAFEDRGGWVSTGISGAIGLVGSVLGEAIDLMKENKKKGNEKSNVFMSAGAKIESVDAGSMGLDVSNTAIHGDTTMLLEGIEEFFEKQAGKKRSKLITELMKKDIESGKLDISKMTPTQLQMLAVDYDYIAVSKLGEIDSNTIFKTYNALNWKFAETPAGIRDEFFMLQQKRGLTYGTDQGSMKTKYHYVTSDGKIIEPGSTEYEQCINNGIELKIEKTADYINIREHMKTKYNLSSKDAERIIETMDVQGGICSNADFVNSIMYYRVQNQKMDDFDIPLYKEGKLNTDETLIDVFMYINDVKHGGKLFEINSDGSLNFLENGKCMSLGTMSASGRTTYKTDIVNSYLSSKGSLIRFLEPEQYNMKYAFDMNRIPSKEVDEALKRADKTVSLNVKAGSKIVFLDGSNTYVKLDDAAHVMTVTGCNRFGFIVDSWGKRAFVSYDEFVSKLGSISITTISK